MSNMNENDDYIEMAKMGSTKKKKSNVLKFLLIGVIVVFGTSFLLFRLFLKEPKVTIVKTETAKETSEGIKNPGIRTDSRAYSKISKDMDVNEAKKAEEKGKSNIPRLMTEEAGLMDGLPVKKEEPKKEVAPQQDVSPAVVPVAAVPPAYVYHKQENRVPTNIDVWLTSEYVPGQIVLTTFKDVAVKETSSKSSKDSNKEISKANIASGTMLYAAIDIGVNSDQEGTPVMATVMSGEYTGAKFIGGFKRMEEKLVLQFNKMVFKGQNLSAQGYAIDPEKYTPGMASSVDTHFMERWGGLFISSLASGFGAATGSSNNKYYYGNNDNPGFFSSSKSLEDRLWMAAGKVGDRMSSQFERNFDKPPTVTLAPGTPIGIFIL